MATRVETAEDTCRFHHFPNQRERQAQRKKQTLLQQVTPYFPHPTIWKTKGKCFYLFIYLFAPAFYLSIYLSVLCFQFHLIFNFLFFYTFIAISMT